MNTRSQMDPAFQWDLKHIYPDKESWEAELASARDNIADVAKIAGTLSESPETLRRGLDAIYGARRRAELVYLYAMLSSSGDNSDTDNQSMQMRALTMITQLGAALSFVNPEILAIEPARLESFISEPSMALYRHILQDLVRTREHTLSDKEEKMLAQLADAAQTPSAAYDMFTDVDLTFPEVTDETGVAAPLTHATFGVFRESRDRRVREEAFNKYFGEYGRYKNTLAALYSGSVKLDAYSSRVRGYSGSLEAALDAGNIPVKVYDSLIEAVHSALPAMRKYLDLRRRALGVEQLHMYDLYVPLIETATMKVEYPQARRMVTQALRPFGDEYLSHIEEAFDSGWIDVYENKGKTAGAFSCGVYGVHPYVLLNYSGKLDDAFTVAHELGHAMHSYLSSSAQDYANHDYSIMVAEVASTVNEVMLTKSLLSQETEKLSRAALLNRLLEGFRTTVFRQTLFAEFEKRTHEMYESGEPLTAEALSAQYRELNLLYYDGIYIDPVTDVEWARIPHFYNAFYVYQYATGFCSAVDIANRITKTGAAEGYLDFLRMGGSAYPLDELRAGGVDLEDPACVLSALSVFEQTVDELDGLLG